MPNSQFRLKSPRRGLNKELVVPEAEGRKSPARGVKWLVFGVGVAVALGWQTPKMACAEEWVATAYCACVRCCGKTDGITASGKVAQAGHTVAVNWLPFGTVVRINGKEYRVEDRGAVSHFGSRKKPKKRVDIYMASHAEALAWGKRTVNVEVMNAG